MDLLDSAVRNNVEWCALVSPRGGAVDAAAGLWLVTGGSPALFPDAVTLRAGVRAEDVAALLAGRDACSVKDSYADLDLGPYGFAELFSARWVGLAHPPLTGRPAGWQVLSEPDDLLAWSAAAGLPDTLPMRLLHDPRVKVLAARRGGRLLAGAVVSSSGAVAGISNVFQAHDEPRLGHGHGPEWVWDQLPAMVGEHFPGQSAVGYEHGADLDAALEAGFSDLGPLQVWVRPAQR